MANKRFNREFLLNRFISHCLWDEHLSDEEKKQLSYLAELLDIPEEYLNNKITEEGKSIMHVNASFSGIGLVAVPTGIISAGFMENMEEAKKSEKEEINYCPYCGKEI